MHRTGLALACFAWVWLIATTLPTHAETIPSPSLLGSLGLNTVPSARMDRPGTARLNLSTLGRYSHASAGVQVSEGLYISLRQSAEGASLREDPDALHPGADIKLRLWRESAHIPEISFGINSAIGTRRFAGEYLTFSKRFGDLDVTAGLGRSRDGNKTDYNTPGDWLTEGTFGFFGGAEYALPVKNLSLKFDYNDERRRAEKKVHGRDAPTAWGVGLSYSPRPWVNIGAGLQGTDAIIGRISLQPAIAHWRVGPAGEGNHEKRLKYRRYSENRVAGNVILPAFGASAPAVLGAGARSLLKDATAETRGVELRPHVLGLRGPWMTIPQGAVDYSADKKSISAEELWNNSAFSTQSDKYFLSKRGRALKGITQIDSFTLTFENHLSLSEKETGILYRNSAIAGAQTMPFLRYFTLGGALRLNLADNYDNLARMRTTSVYPVRSDVDAFTQERLSLENFHVTATHSITPEIHTMLTSGYVEEEYYGSGAELLYRPFSGRFALGAEAWGVRKRDPSTRGNLGLSAQADYSLLLNAWYDVPQSDLTLSLSAGQFLGGDRGGSLGVEKVFDNGASIGGFVTLTNNSDFDATGEPLHAYHGLYLSVPLGNLPFLPDGSKFNTEISPALRDRGQRVRAPLRLYDLTEKFTMDHLSDHWSEFITDKKEPPEGGL